MIFFRLPFSNKIFTAAVTSVQDCVTFFPFNNSETVQFKGDLREISVQEFIKSSVTTDLFSLKLADFQAEDQNEYEHKIEKVITFIKDNNLQKLVISRQKFVPFDGHKVDLSQTFLNLIETYPNAFVYVFSKEGKNWIGAFSEILGKFNKRTSEFETMSLAGTLPLNENWTDKEISEQQHVTGFIHNILEKYADQIRQSETVDHISGNIKHLRTNFKLKIKAEQLEDLISELHPTPAVCGIPKDFCLQAIDDFETHSRKLYAGYIKVEDEEFIQYFVNLRCAELFQNAAIIYVGGGITAQSSPQKEWRETELKAEAILKNLSFID